MRASFKPFFLGILFTSITWAIVLYFYVSLNPINSASLKHSIPFVTVKLQNSSPKTDVISNYLDEFRKDENQHKNLGDLSKSKGKTVNELEANLGLVRNNDDQKIREDGYSHHAFNVLVSSRLDYHRKIPDSRHKL